MLNKRSYSAGSAIFVIVTLSLTFILILILLSASTKAASPDKPKDNSKFPFGCPVK